MAAPARSAAIQIVRPTESHKSEQPEKVKKGTYGRTTHVGPLLCGTVCLRKTRRVIADFLQMGPNACVGTS